ncbi:MAG: methyltransferase domain-containing protein [Phycisphaerae bacterium]|nr:methyltransferase domain-containing protein [Phycisphaerae bacterium]
MSKRELQELLTVERFGRASAYDAEWVVANEMGPNALWLAEWLCEVMDLQPGMRVLDMGCGKALSSIFLAREFGVQVWATDLWIPAAENWRRVREAGLEDRVFPIHAEARALPYADEFFDAVVSLDSYHYYGTDVHYLEFHMLKLLKRGGQIGIVSPASPQEVPHPRPDHLDEEWHWVQSVAWWRRHWERCRGLEVRSCEAVPDGWEYWVRWLEMMLASGRENRPGESADELAQLRADQGRYLGFVRMIAERK